MSYFLYRLRNSDLFQFVVKAGALLSSIATLVIQGLLTVTATTAVFYMWYDSRPNVAEVNATSGESFLKSPEPRYFFEAKARTCFAYLYQERRLWFRLPTGGPSLTYVPCTKGVIDQLVNRSAVPSDFVPVDAEDKDDEAPDFYKLEQ